MVTVKDGNGQPMTAEQCIKVAEKIEQEISQRPEHWHRSMRRTAREWRNIAARLLTEREV